MNAYELADDVKNISNTIEALEWVQKATPLLRQQTDRIAELETVLRSIANEPIELSHDKIKWQCQDHIRWAKEILK